MTLLGNKSSGLKVLVPHGCEQARGGAEGEFVCSPTGSASSCQHRAVRRGGPRARGPSAWPRHKAPVEKPFSSLGEKTRRAHRSVSPAGPQRPLLLRVGRAGTAPTKTARAPKTPLNNGPVISPLTHATPKAEVLKHRATHFPLESW